MIIISPLPAHPGVTLPSCPANGVIRAIGTDDHSMACFELFERTLEIDHLCVFKHDSDESVNCITAASRTFTAATRKSISRFVERCHRVDPALSAVKSRSVDAACIVKISLGDIRDGQYRHCFSSTNVQERLSFFHQADSDLYQLSVFRTADKRPFSVDDIAQFSPLASFAVTSAVKHNTFKQMAAGIPRRLDLSAIEQLLQAIAQTLSKREIQVCARVITGMTIDGTALDLDIKRTSVVTYRQRAYAKLNISRQNELVALVNNLRSNAVSAQAA